MISDATVDSGVCALLIEADGGTAERVDGILAAAGDIACVRVTDPDAVLPEAEECQPTVIVQDADAPGTLDELRGAPATCDVPVIVLSSRGDADAKADAFARGASDYVVKPAEARELVARIRYHSQAYLNLVERMEIEKHRSLSQMVAGVAHELNTPLGIARTAVEMIAVRVESPAVRAALEERADTRDVAEVIAEATALMQRNLDRAHALTEQFKKVSVQQLAEERERVRLPEVIEDIVDLYRIEARRSGMTVEVCSELEGDGEWEGCPGSLTQIVLNCLSNAERYAYTGGGRVEIRLSPGRRRPGAEPWYVLVVQDFGAGMEAERRERVFEPFYTTGRGSGGSGLGMAIVYNLATSSLQGMVPIQPRDEQV